MAQSHNFEGLKSELLRSQPLPASAWNRFQSGFTRYALALSMREHQQFFPDTKLHSYVEHSFSPGLSVSLSRVSVSTTMFERNCV